MKIMELKDLNSGWQNAPVENISEADLLKMTRIKNHPSIKKIRTRLIVETICFVFLAAVYYDWFDGHQKPLYANILLIMGLLSFFANDVIGFISLEKKLIGSDVKISLERYLIKIKKLAVFSQICNVVYSLSLLVFFTSVIDFSKEKSFILLGFLIILTQMLLWSQRIWSKWIKNLEQQLNSFDLEEPTILPKF